MRYFNIILYMCMWIRTNTESVEGFSARHVPKICLLEVMQSASDDNSAESTAQKLLQFIASQFSEVDMDDMNVTQTVSYLFYLCYIHTYQYSGIGLIKHILSSVFWSN